MTPSPRDPTDPASPRDPAAGERGGLARVAGLDELDAVDVAAVAMVRFEDLVTDGGGAPAAVAAFDDPAPLRDARHDVTVATLDGRGAAGARRGSRRSGAPRERSARGGHGDPSGVSAEDGPVHAAVPDGAASPPDGAASPQRQQQRSGRTAPVSGRRSRGRSARSGESAEAGALLDADADADADPETVAREICLSLLTARARTRQELAQALRRKGVPDEAANAVLERFDDVGLIDDGAFAAQWVRSRHAVRGLGRRALAVELRRKGVADDVAGEALAGVDAEAEDRRARELVDRKLRTMPSDTEERRVTAGRRLVGMLARRGYSGGTAYRVVREALAARGAELAELADADLPDE